MLALLKHELIVYTLSAIGMIVCTMFEARHVSHSILLFIEHGLHASRGYEVLGCKNWLLMDWLKRFSVQLLVLEPLGLLQLISDELLLGS